MQEKKEEDKLKGAGDDAGKKVDSAQKKASRKRKIKLQTHRIPPQTKAAALAALKNAMNQGNGGNPAGAAGAGNQAGGGAGGGGLN